MIEGKENKRIGARDNKLHTIATDCRIEDIFLFDNKTYTTEIFNEKNCVSSLKVSKDFAL